MTKTLTITQPDDWHIHLRDGEYLATTVKHAKKQFNRAIVMPNLKPPITTIAQAKTYREKIMELAGDDTIFEPLMTLYLTQQITADTIKAAKQSGIIFGCKLYPAGSTTHSDYGIEDINQLDAVFASMEEVDLPLLIHGEVTDPSIDIFDREAVFIERILQRLTQKFSNLRIVLEHVTTKDACDFVREANSHVAATITPHHLLLNRNDLLVGGVKPHYYCLPVLKRRSHQEALITAATSGNPKFFIGTDSAPHPVEQKESTCGCAGIYSANAAIELYAEAFEQANALNKLEGFASFFGPDFYQLPRNTQEITLIKEPWDIPTYYAYGHSKVIPFRAGQTIHWKLVAIHE